MDPVFILGCGYTGSRVAHLLLDRGIPVAASARSTSQLAELASRGLRIVEFDAEDPTSLNRLVSQLEPRSRLLYSIPTLSGPQGRWEPAGTILRAAAPRLARVVYLSTTGVYGASKRVDETTPVAPVTKRQRLRVEAEQAVMAGPWQSLIVRPAAIYGPGRGVHVALPAGNYKLVGDGSNFVSRIHVDDLAAIAAAALLSDLTGAYPAADEHACSAREIARFCADILGLGGLEFADSKDVSETRRSDRRVDGSALRGAIGVSLRYRSYRQGIPASLT